MSSSKDKIWRKDMKKKSPSCLQSNSVCEEIYDLEKSIISLDVEAPESEQEQISTLGGGPLKGTQDTEQRKESQRLCRPQAEENMPFSLHQRISKLDTELSREREEKDYYYKLYNESQDELLKFHAILDTTTMLGTSNSSSSYDSDYVNEKEQISTSEVDVIQQRQDMEERNEEEITQLSSEQQSVCEEIYNLANSNARHDIIEPLTSSAQPENWAETGESTNSISLEIVFSGTEDEDILGQDVEVQENMQIKRQNTPAQFGGHGDGETNPDEGAVSSATRRFFPNSWSSSAYFLRNILVTVLFSFVGAYIFHEFMSYYLFSILEPFCTFENVLEAPF